MGHNDNGSSLLDRCLLQPDKLDSLVAPSRHTSPFAELSASMANDNDADTRQSPLSRSFVAIMTEILSTIAGRVTSPANMVDSVSNVSGDESANSVRQFHNLGMTAGQTSHSSDPPLRDIDNSNILEDPDDYVSINKESDATRLRHLPHYDDRGSVH